MYPYLLDIYFIHIKYQGYDNDNNIFVANNCEIYEYKYSKFHPANVYDIVFKKKKFSYSYFSFITGTIQGGRRYWAVYYTSPQSFVMTFPYLLAY